MTHIRSNDHVLGSVQFRRLSDEQCQRLYWACLEILERTGVRLYDQEALDLLKKTGVPATDGNRVRIPAETGPTGHLRRDPELVGTLCAWGGDQR